MIVKLIALASTPRLRQWKLVLPQRLTLRLPAALMYPLCLLIQRWRRSPYSNGVITITGVAAGTSTITVTKGSATATISVTVTAA